MSTSPRWTLAPRSTLGLALALALVFLVSLVTAWQIGAARRATLDVRQSLQVLNAVESATRHLVDAETAQRGFLLTDRDAYLEPLTRARDALPADLAALAGLVRADP